MIKTGADIISARYTRSDAAAIVGSAISGTVSIDSVGATITSLSGGITAGTSTGDIFIGGLNGGIASTITASNGTGIFAVSGTNQGAGNINVTLASAGTITALNGVDMRGNNVVFTSFGRIVATNNAVNGSDGRGNTTVILQASSFTQGAILGGGNNDQFQVFAGANIAAATFNGGAGTDTVVLKGGGTASLDLSRLANIENLQKDEAGTWTISGTGSFTAVVNTGTLNVSGRVAGSGISVANGGTLAGTGTVSTTSVASGGTLAPGIGGAPGTLTVSGNLNLASGANFVDFVTSSAAGLVSVSGTASLNGAAVANLAPGTYAFGQRFTLITATGGVGGTFASLNTSGLPTNLKGRLSYDATNVYLNLDPNSLAPSLSGGTANQTRTVSAIDAAVAAGAMPPSGFLSLYGLSGPALNGALDQISGQIGPNVANAASQSFLSFLSMTGQGGSGGNFAPGSAYGGADAPHRAQLGTGETRVWGAAYGGHVGLSADTASGAAGLSASNVGMIGGADLQLDDGFLIGATAGFGRQDFRSGNGTGNSDDVMIGLYARKDAGPFYVTAAFGLGWHQIATARTIMVSGTDVLQGKQDANDYGGRAEAGWRMALDAQYALSPYVAVAAESFETPAYAETATSGASTFALSYAAHTSTLGRSELGAHLGRSYDTENGMLSADLRAAWAHDLGDTPFTQATFLSLPGASFTTSGVRPDKDTALLGVDLQVKQASGLFFGVKAETQLGARTTILEGMGNVGWRW